MLNPIIKTWWKGISFVVHKVLKCIAIHFIARRRYLFIYDGYVEIHLGLFPQSPDYFVFISLIDAGPGRELRVLHPVILQQTVQTPARCFRHILLYILLYFAIYLAIYFAILMCSPIFSLRCCRHRSETVTGDLGGAEIRAEDCLLSRQRKLLSRIWRIFTRIIIQLNCIFGTNKMLHHRENRWIKTQQK